MMRVADYVAGRLVEEGCSDAFMVTGGGAMHLNDAFGKCAGLKYTCFHHEQACAIASESYARLTGRLAPVLVTSGPGGTNALTGVLGAWLDSIPMIIISGQVRWDTLVRSTGLPLRQLGDQEFDITKVAATMAKYAVMVTEPGRIRYHLERALFLARSGRPGPTWLDIPLNIQSATVDPECLDSYDPAEDSHDLAPGVTDALADEILSRIRTAERPVLLVGTGVRVAGAHAALLRVVDQLHVPVLTAWNAHDCLPDDHPQLYGRPSTLGDRAGNFVIQNCDLLLSLGCRLNLRQIGYSWAAFARGAYKIIVDVDEAELRKPTVRPDLPVHADAGDFLFALERRLATRPLESRVPWQEWCAGLRGRYPSVHPHYWERSELVNPYCFVDALTRLLPEDEIVVLGNATAAVVAFQAAHIKRGQRYYSNSGCASMGYDLPAAIGACIGSGRRRTICLAGDGSLQMNVQELATVAYHRLPIKLFVLNNNGYLSIRQTQTNYFRPPLVGCDASSGVGFPSVEGLASAYGIPYWVCSTHSALQDVISSVLGSEGPAICEVQLSPDQPFAPRVSSAKLPDGRMVSKPLEDMWPFLDREEFHRNMIVDEWEPDSR